MHVQMVWVWREPKECDAMLSKQWSYLLTLWKKMTGLVAQIERPTSQKATGHLSEVGGRIENHES